MRLRSGAPARKPVSGAPALLPPPASAKGPPKVRSAIEATETPPELASLTVSSLPPPPSEAAAASAYAMPVTTRKAHTSTISRTAGPNPMGAVTLGRARNPPPMDVPAMMETASTSVIGGAGGWRCGRVSSGPSDSFARSTKAMGGERRRTHGASRSARAVC
eukprot:scaffold309290_cov30-Tisochrysis_lutea.AAC.3